LFVHGVFSSQPAPVWLMVLLRVLASSGLFFVLALMPFAG